MEAEPRRGVKRERVGGAAPEVRPLHVLHRVRQVLVGRLGQHEGEGGAQQGAKAAKHHGSQRADAPQEVQHGRQDSAHPRAHGADTDPVLPERWKR